MRNDISRLIRHLGVAVALSAVASGCSSTTMVAPPDAATGAQHEAATSDVERPTTVSEAATAGSLSPLIEAGARVFPEPWDHAIKAERWARAHAFAHELFEYFHPGVDPSRHLLEQPDEELLARSASGDTVEGDLRIRVPDAPDFDLLVHFEANLDTGYSRAWGDGTAVIEFGAYRSRIEVRETAGGQVENVRIVDEFGAGNQWTRGVESVIHSLGSAATSPEEWYEGLRPNPASWAMLRTSSAEELWQLLGGTEDAGATVSADGRTITASWSDDLPSQLLVMGQAFDSPWADSYTLTTVAGDDGSLRTVMASIRTETGQSWTSELTIREYGGELDVPLIDAARAPHVGIPTGQPIDYQWHATVTPVGSTPWEATGQVQPRAGGSAMRMTVASLMALRGESPHPLWYDHHITRFGDGRTVGLRAEVTPERYRGSLVDPHHLYDHDPFGLPAAVFPTDGPYDHALWSYLHTLPSETELDGWDAARITHAVVDARTWAAAGGWLGIGRHGIAGWIEPGDGESFAVTVGAGTDGLVERVRIEQHMADNTIGQVLEFDVEHRVTEPFQRPTGAVHDNFYLSGAGEEEDDWIESQFDLADFDNFFDAARQEYAAGDDTRTPAHLTVVARRHISDIPPRIEPVRWSTIYEWEDATMWIPGQRLRVLCLDWNDHDWHVGPNVHESLWRSLDGIESLDDVLIDQGGMVYEFDVYAFDVDRPDDDPCRWEPPPRP